MKKFPALFGLHHVLTAVREKNCVLCYTTGYDVVRQKKEEIIAYHTFMYARPLSNFFFFSFFSVCLFPHKISGQLLKKEFTKKEGMEEKFLWFVPCGRQDFTIVATRLSAS